MIACAYRSHLKPHLFIDEQGGVPELGAGEVVGGVTLVAEDSHGRWRRQAQERQSQHERRHSSINFGAKIKSKRGVL
jgi:hypothetical protein